MFQNYQVFFVCFAFNTWMDVSWLCALRAADEATVRSALILLRDKCLACHNDRKSEGGYDLSRFERMSSAGDSGKAPLAGGDSEKGELLRRITTDDDSERMPSGAQRLDDKAIEVLRSWLGSQTNPIPQKSGSIVDWIEGDNPELPLHSEPKVAHYDRVPFPIFAFDSGCSTLFAAGSHEVLVWDFANQRLTRRWTGLGRFVSAIAVDPATGTVAIASGKPGVQGNIHLVFPSNLDLAYRLANLPDVPVSISFSPKDSKIAIGGMDGSIKVYDSQLRTKLYDALGHADQVLSVAWNSEGTQFATASRDRTCRVYDAKTFHLLTSYSGHERAVGSVAFAGHGMITLDETGTLRLWSKNDSDKLLTKRTGLPQRLQRIAIHDDHISWLDERSLESVVIEIREENEKTEKPEDKPKTKKVYQFKSVHSVPIAANQIAHWTLVQVPRSVVFSTRDGWIHRMDLQHLDTKPEASATDLMKLYPTDR